MYRIEIGTRAGNVTLWAVLIDNIDTLEIAEMRLEREKQLDMRRMLRIRGGTENDQVHEEGLLKTASRRR